MARLNPGATIALILLTGCHHHDIASTAPTASPASQLADSTPQFTPGAWVTEVKTADLAIEGLNGALSAQLKTGQGGFSMHTDRTCLTPDQAAHPERRFLAKGDDNCTYRQFSMTGGKLAGTMHCGDRGDTSTMTMTGTYTADSYAMNLALDGHDDGARLNMHLSVSGHRVGACRPGDT